MQVERVDHRVRCLESPALLALLAAGLCATVDSDEPACVGGDLADKVIASFDAPPQRGGADAYRLMRNRFGAAFVSADVRAGWITQLDAAFSAAAVPSAHASLAALAEHGDTDTRAIQTGKVVVVVLRLRRAEASASVVDSSVLAVRVVSRFGEMPCTPLRAAISAT